jgi:hypothetical protein
MHKYLDIELFGWNKFTKNWWSITILRVASGSWQWYLLMIEEDLDEVTIQWFSFRKTKYEQE